MDIVTTYLKKSLPNEMGGYGFRWLKWHTISNGL